MPFVRIIILNYNSSSHTLNIVKQLKKQSFKKFEIIVVDNASRREEANLLIENLPKYVETIFSKKNSGYANGNNLGMKYKTGNIPDYFFVLNNDVIIENECFIEKLVESFNFPTQKELIAVSPLVNTISLNIPLENQIQVRRILSSKQLFIVCCAILKPLFKATYEKYVYKNEMPYINKLMECDSINGAAFLIKASFMKDINYLDEGTFLFFEEIILGEQIKIKDGTCLLNGQISLKHLQGASTGSSTAKFNLEMERYKRKSGVYFFAKYRNFNRVSQMFYFCLKEIEFAIKSIRN